MDGWITRRAQCHAQRSYASQKIFSSNNSWYIIKQSIGLTKLYLLICIWSLCIDCIWCIPLRGVLCFLDIFKSNKRKSKTLKFICKNFLNECHDTFSLLWFKTWDNYKIKTNIGLCKDPPVFGLCNAREICNVMNRMLRLTGMIFSEGFIFWFIMPTQSQFYAWNQLAKSEIECFFGYVICHVFKITGLQRV